MNSATTLHVTTTNSAATQALAGQLARACRGGEVIELASDLGGGKTTFVKGLAAGLGYPGEVTSPTFTLSQIYRLNSGLELHHYDLYRLTDAGVVGMELAEDLGDPQVITVIEWAGLAEAELPKDRLTITLTPTGDTQRDVKLVAGGPKSTALLAAIKEAA